jgi:Wiskott-Aldrich syndrome protein
MPPRPPGRPLGGGRNPLPGAGRTWLNPGLPPPRPPGPAKKPGRGAGAPPTGSAPPLTPLAPGSGPLGGFPKGGPCPLACAALPPPAPPPKAAGGAAAAAPAPAAQGGGAGPRRGLEGRKWPPLEAPAPLVAPSRRLGGTLCGWGGLRVAAPEFGLGRDPRVPLPLPLLLPLLLPVALASPLLPPPPPPPTPAPAPARVAKSVAEWGEGVEGVGVMARPHSSA